jgi:hypothetical protein
MEVGGFLSLEEIDGEIVNVDACSMMTKRW